ncbi:MAG: Cdc6/Cdc18 family protein [Candidatus Njordarchaeales archaeon]
MAPQIIVNPEVFKSDEIFHKSDLWHDIIEEIISDLVSFFENGESFTSWIIVYETRLLKDLFLKLLMEKSRKRIEDKAIEIYINCRRARRVYNTVLSIVKGVDASLPTRGLSLEELMDETIRRLKRLKKGLLIYLDHLGELFSEEEFDKARDLLYILSRLNERAESEKIVSLATVATIDSRKYDEIFNQIDGSTRASFFRKVIELRMPTPEEIKILLSNVAKKGLRENAVSEETLEKISHWVLDKYEGDPKKAVELLLEAALIAEKLNDDTIDIKHVNLAIKTARIRSTDLDYVLQPLRKHFLVLLLAIVRALKEKQREFVTRVEIEPYYNELCRQFNERPRKTTQLLRYIKELAKDLESIVKVEVSGVDQRGRSTRIYVNAPLNDLERAILERLTNQ